MISINEALVISAENIQNLRVFGFIKGEINGAIKACGRRVTAISIPVPTAPFPSKMRNHKIEVNAKLSAVIFTIQRQTERKNFFATQWSHYSFLKKSPLQKSLIFTDSHQSISYIWFLGSMQERNNLRNIKVKKGKISSPFQHSVHMEL